MPAASHKVKKQTLYISIAASLLIGFVCGVLYSALQTPTPVSTGEHNHEDAAALIMQLEQQTSSTPEDVQAWVQLGHAYFDSDQPKKAISAYQQALTLTPGNTDVMTDLGVMYRRNGQPQKAVEMFNNVLQVDPAHEQARFNKGVVLLNDLNDRKGAIMEWKRLVSANPEASTPSGTLVSDIISQLEQQQ